jgi:heme/copper-type cytochrome/quinol oxidase subunit 2
LLKINEHSLIDFKNFINFNTLFNLTSEIQNNYLLNNDKIFYKKTQYKHMRKSMANMIRIQNDKAVAMPVDTRIQFLTVSKDIIHS